MIRHCIIDTLTGKIVNCIEYDTIQTGIPKGFENEQPHWICVASDTMQIYGTYLNGVYTEPQPHPSWTLVNNVWQPPVPKPDETCVWDEESLTWNSTNG
jgi:hypothetical protein